jgi:hypothetical protein
MNKDLSMGIILVILVVLLILGGLPTWRHSKDWGYAPVGGLGVLLLVLVILMVVNVVPRGF